MPRIPKEGEIKDGWIVEIKPTAPDKRLSFVFEDGNTYTTHTGVVYIYTPKALDKLCGHTNEVKWEAE